MEELRETLRLLLFQPVVHDCAGMADWIHVRVLAAPLKDLQRCPPDTIDSY